MKRVYDFLKKVEVYYWATVKGNQPRVCPFGTVNEYEGKLYIQTGKVKPTTHQLAADPKAKISVFTEGTWLRVACEFVEDDHFETKNPCLMHNISNLRRTYDENDGNTQAFYIKNAIANFYSFGKEPILVEF